MRTNNYPKLPERLKECRIRLGLTQKQLAERAGISPSQLSKYESGKELPREFSGQKLAKVLLVTLDYLYGITDNMEQLNQGDEKEKIMRLLSSEKPLLPLHRTNSAELKKEFVVNQVEADFAVEIADDSMSPQIMKGAICYGRKILFLRYMHNETLIGFFPSLTGKDAPLIRRFYHIKNGEDTLFILEPLNQSYKDRRLLDAETFIKMIQQGGIITHVLNRLPLTY